MADHKEGAAVIITGASIGIGNTESLKYKCVQFVLHALILMLFIYTCPNDLAYWSGEFC